MQSESQPTSPQPSSTTQWFNRRPIPVFIIAALCILQFLGIALYLADHWYGLLELVRTGAESPFGFVFKLVYPFFLLGAGLALLFMRKLAIVLFSIYCAWGVGKIVVQTIDFPGYVSLAMVFGVLVYCFRLQQRGLLR
ncbi:hypothetical protein [Roseateles sp. P5_E7]